MHSFRRALRGFRLPSFATPRPDSHLGPGPAGRRTLRFYFIKPSTYDDDGYALQFRWGTIPNNTLTVLAALNDAVAAARADVHIQTVLWDELVDGALSSTDVEAICERAARDGVDLVIGLAGVQTNQYPRARDIALQFVRLQATVLMGGFHVSSHAPTREFLQPVGITVVVGEAETTWPVIVDDYLRGALQPCYRVTDGVRAKTGQADITVPPIGNVALPKVDARYLQRFFNPSLTTIETSRGCPFTCSYCAVKNVMGRTMRAREPQRVVDWIREAHDRHGIRSLFLVDDDFFRSPRWEEVLSRMAALRRDGRDLWFMMQADVESAADAAFPHGQRSRRFIDLAAAAGCYTVFMGFESFDPVNLEQAQKFHNEAKQDRRQRAARPRDAAARVKARYRQAIDNWHRAGVGVHCGYIIGLPHDGKGCGARAAQELAEVGVDLASFFVHTLLPGTEDYFAAQAAGTIVNHDFNDYDSMHYAGSHPTLTTEEIHREFREAWTTFYSWRRVAWSLASAHRVAGLGLASRLGMLMQQLYFTYSIRRGWHPMLGGIGRRYDPATRRRVVWDRDAAEHYLGVVPPAHVPRPSRLAS